MIPWALKRSRRKVQKNEEKHSKRMMLVHQKKKGNGKTQKWFILIAIWMKSIEMVEKEAGIEHFHSSHFYCPQPPSFQFQ